MALLLLTSTVGQNRETGGKKSQYRCMKGVALFALFVGCVLASSCTGKTESLESRVHAYWQARIQGKAEQAFTFEAPGTKEKEAYLKEILTSPIIYTGKSVVAITENGNEAEVKLQMNYMLPGLSQPVTSALAEKWIKIRGQWYRQQQTDRDAGRE